MNNHIVESYIQNTNYNSDMPDATITQHQGNPLCGDDILVHLKIHNNQIIDYKYSGNCSTITKAAASFLGDIIIGQDIHTVLSWDIKTIESHNFIVSSRRKRAAVIALLGCRNGIHRYLQTGRIDNFEDILY